MLKKLLTGLSVVALVLPTSAQESAAPAEAPATISQPTEEADDIQGFSPAAMQEWQAIEKELANHEDNPAQLLQILNDNLQKDLLEETKQLLRAVKVQVLTMILENIYQTAETEADILQAKEASIELVSMIPDETDRTAALAEIEQRFADPAALLQQVIQARSEQEAAETSAAEDAAEAPKLTEDDYARISDIRTELEKMATSDEQLEHLNTIRSQESPGVQSWIQPHMVQLLLDELNSIQMDGINTVEDLLRYKTAFTKVIHYCYPEEEKARALEQLEAEFANPEEMLRMIKAQEEFMSPEPEEEQEESADEPSHDTVTA